MIHPHISSYHKTYTTKNNNKKQIYYFIFTAPAHFNIYPNIIKVENYYKK